MGGWRGWRGAKKSGEGQGREHLNSPGAAAEGRQAQPEQALRPSKKSPRVLLTVSDRAGHPRSNSHVCHHKYLTQSVSHQWVSQGSDRARAGEDTREQGQTGRFEGPKAERLETREQIWGRWGPAGARYLRRGTKKIKNKSAELHAALPPPPVCEARIGKRQGELIGGARV